MLNGNNISDNNEFDHYLKKLGYSFKNQSNELGGYAALNSKKISLFMDVGASPDKKFSSDYQAGALSFEIISNGKKLICNSGYFQNYGHQLNEISRSSNCNIGRMYRYATLLLGMRPAEHEYKLMGLAAYNSHKYGEEAYKIYADTLQVDGLGFKYNKKIKDHFFYFKDKLPVKKSRNIHEKIHKLPSAHQNIT